jgi:hypothetical protein
MTTLFGETCPCCGQSVSGQVQTPFSDFWRDVPNKVGRDAAQKAWHKLGAADRTAAHSAVKSYFAWFARTYSQASPMHPSTYLNQRRWMDEGWRGQTRQEVDPLSTAAAAIRSGKRYMCTNIPGTVARALVSRGVVSEAQCRDVGIAI